MGEVIPLPDRSTVLPDTRGQGRVLRVTWHPEEAVFVLSTWRGGACVASVRLAAADAAGLVSSLATGMVGALPAPATVRDLEAGPPPG